MAIDSLHSGVPSNNSNNRGTPDELGFGLLRLPRFTPIPTMAAVNIKVLDILDDDDAPADICGEAMANVEAVATFQDGLEAWRGKVFVSQYDIENGNLDSVLCVHVISELAQRVREETNEVTARFLEIGAYHCIMDRNASEEMRELSSAIVEVNQASSLISDDDVGEMLVAADKAAFEVWTDEDGGANLTVSYCHERQAFTVDFSCFDYSQRVTRNQLADLILKLSRCGFFSADDGLKESA